MSRIGKKPVSVLDGVKVSIDGQSVKIEGPKGNLQYDCRPEVKVEYNEEVPSRSWLPPRVTIACPGPSMD